MTTWFLKKLLPLNHFVPYSGNFGAPASVISSEPTVISSEARNLTME
jgi:hypothetical protein